MAFFSHGQSSVQFCFALPLPFPPPPHLLGPLPALPRALSCLCLLTSLSSLPTCFYFLPYAFLCLEDTTFKGAPVGIVTRLLCVFLLFIVELAAFVVITGIDPGKCFSSLEFLSEARPPEVALTLRLLWPGG